MDRPTQKAICAHCAAKYLDSDDCSLRLAGAGSLGGVYDGLALVVRSADALQRAEKRSLVRQFSGTAFAGLADRLGPSVTADLAQLGEHFGLHQETVQHRGREGIGFYGSSMGRMASRGRLLFGGGMKRSEQQGWVEGFFGALIFRENAGYLSEGDLWRLHKHLSGLISACDTLVVSARRGQRVSLVVARSFLEWFQAHCENALRYGLIVEVSA